MMRIHWHRRDLRVGDNPALSSNGGEVAGLYVSDPDRMERTGSAGIAYLIASLRALRAAYRDRGGELYIRKGDPRSLVPEVAKEADAPTISWEMQYSGFASERDEDVVSRLEDQGIDHESGHGAVLHAPGDITTDSGDLYKVFTYFGRKWMNRSKNDPVPAPPTLAQPIDESGALPDADETEPVLPAGESAAERRLATFCSEDIYRYEYCRDRPGERCTSRLSQDLAFGTIGIRDVWRSTEEARDSAGSQDHESSVEAFQRQLAWREFYQAMIDVRPEMTRTNLVAFDRPIEWQSDQDEFEAWKAGRTGFPIIDAGMRQLETEAFMHNRVRMVVASFLTKDLLTDWRKGCAWFREQLVDHDPANNAGGWQWAASTGTDAQPYFRVFNPMSQARRHDHDAEYIRRHVEELRDVPTDAIHHWTELSRSERDEYAPAYPAPIVDHQTRREAALDMYRRARGDRSGE